MSDHRKHEPNHGGDVEDFVGKSTAIDPIDPKLDDAKWQEKHRKK